MAEDEVGGYVVPPGKEHLHQSSDECPFPLEELRPPIKGLGDKAAPEAPKGSEEGKPRE